MNQIEVYSRNSIFMGAKSSEVVEENTNEKCNRFRTFRAKYNPYVRTTYPLYEVAIEDAVALNYLIVASSIRRK